MAENLTREMVLAAARAAFDRILLWREATDAEMMGVWGDNMQAALLAVAPLIRRAALEEARQMASNLLRDMMVAPTSDYVAAYEMVHKLHNDLHALAEKQP